MDGLGSVERMATGGRAVDSIGYSDWLRVDGLGSAMGIATG